MANKFSKLVKTVYKLPTFSHEYLLTKLFCSQVKYANTSRVKIHRITNTETELSLANIKRVAKSYWRCSCRCRIFTGRVCDRHCLRYERS